MIYQGSLSELLLGIVSAHSLHNGVQFCGDGGARLPPLGLDFRYLHDGLSNRLQRYKNNWLFARE